MPLDRGGEGGGVEWTSLRVESCAPLSRGERWDGPCSRGKSYAARHKFSVKKHKSFALKKKFI